MPHSRVHRTAFTSALLVCALLLIGLTLSGQAVPPPIARAEVLGGVVGTGTPGSCSEAALVAALSGGGTVTFNCGPNPYTITLTSQKIVATNTTIDGGGKITLSGGNTNRLFWVSGARLTLVGLTLTSGQIASSGGCVFNSAGTLETSNTTFSGCSATGASGHGGAIYNSGGIVALTDSSLMNNTVDANGGGLYVYSGRATLTNVSVLGNTANHIQSGSGGGLYITATAQVTITGGQVSNNHIGWQGEGGGIFAFNSTTRLSNASVNSNVANNAGSGGGLYVEQGSVRVTGGAASGNSGLFNGGGLALKNARADLDGVTLASNVASSNGGGFSAFQSTVVLTDVVISDNEVGSDGAGVDCYTCAGGFTRVTISGNRGDVRNGGGMNAYRSTLSLMDSTFRNNTNRDGGGIYNSDSTLTLDGVTINNNSATGLGGGVYNDEGVANFTNSTVSANTAITGGAFYNDAFLSPAVLRLLNVTVKDNGATDGGGIYNVNDAHAAIYMTNTILADSPSGGNCKGKNVTSSRYGISSDNTCVLAGTGNHINTPVLLTFLTNNGGATKTHLPKPESPAVDGVIGSDCPSVDQRDVARPLGGSCDIGSVERAPGDPALPVAAFLPLVMRAY